MTGVTRPSDHPPAMRRKPLRRRLENSTIAVGLTLSLIAVCFLVGLVFSVAPWVVILIGAAAIGIIWLAR
jgi:hypothetical protein